VKRSWLSPADWKLIQNSVPVTCIDVLPVRFSASSRHDLRAGGLILRETPHGRKWCLIGGRLIFRELFCSAVRRQLTEALGRHTKPRILTDHQPLYIAQYLPGSRRSFALDPRQHSVGLTYAVEVEGIPSPRGEAIEFEWFQIANIPPPRQVGFRQERVITACLRLLRNRDGFLGGIRCKGQLSRSSTCWQSA
jgi:ADP-ribose pyrophosphatase YjhB (NUDIX family)